MTKLNLRKNLSSVLYSTAQAVEEFKMPNASEKVYEYRVRLAALVMPRDAKIILEREPKE